MDYQSILKSRFTTVGLSILLLLVMVITAKLLAQKREVDSEIAKLKAEAEEIESQNTEFSNLIKYFNTPEYQDRQAREKLNLQKEGEHVVILPKFVEDETAAAAAKEQNRSNPKKWFEYFFGPSSDKQTN
jgi:cell division protein FtsB